MDGKELARRIVDARNRAGFTQAQLAEAANLSRDVVANIETDRRRVSALDLAAIARGLGVGIDWLLTDPPPSVAAYRSNLQPSAPSRPIDALLETLLRDVNFVSAQSPNRIPSLRGGEGRLMSRDDAEAFADEARREAGLDPTEPVKRVADAAFALGVLVFSADPREAAAPEGAAAEANACGVAVVNGTLAVGRRRLVAAHEIAHLLTRDGYRVDWDTDQVSGDITESRCDQFARAFLLPAVATRERLTGLAELDRVNARNAIVRVASEYAVDMSTLARRLEDLALIDHAGGGRIRGYRTVQSDIVELDLHVGSDLAAPSAPRGYQKIVLDLYRSETVTDDRAIALLHGGFTEADLPDRDPLPEDAIRSLL